MHLYMGNYTCLNPGGFTGLLYIVNLTRHMLEVQICKPESPCSLDARLTRCETELSNGQWMAFQMFNICVTLPQLYRISQADDIVIHVRANDLIAIPGLQLLSSS